MRGAIGLVAALVICSGTARAEPKNWTVPEHKLKVADEGTVPPKLNEDIEPSPQWDWPQRHLAAGRDFADPFLGVELYPEVSAGLLVSAEDADDEGRIAYGSWINLQLYALEVKVPLISRLDGEDTSPNVRAALKIPFAIPGHPQHRVAVIGSAIIQDATPAISRSSSGQLMYGFGGGGFTVQVRGGYGYEQFQPSEPLRLGALYGALLGFRAGHFQPMVEFDAIRTTGTRSDRFTLVPALRIFPDRQDTLQIGVGGLLSFGRGSEMPNNRFGGTLDLSYNFL